MISLMQAMTIAHIERVMKNAEEIMATEPTANEEVVRLAVFCMILMMPNINRMTIHQLLEILQEIGARR